MCSLNFGQTSRTCLCLNLSSIRLSARLSTLEVFCPSSVTLDSTSSLTTDRRQVDDFGIDDELPENPFLFVLPAGRHPTFPDLDVLITHPDGVVKLNGRQRFIHNQKGVYHEVQYTKKGRKLFLFERREDLERFNKPRRNEESIELEAPKKTFGRLRQISSRPASPSPSKRSVTSAWRSLGYQEAHSGLRSRGQVRK